MSPIIRALSTIAIALLNCSPITVAQDRVVLAGRVTKVVDGDTIDVALQSGPIRIRFHGVDAPEKAQAHGKEASAALASLIMGREVQIEPFEQDRYERLIGIVYLGELNVNADLIRNGHAWAFRRYMRKADASLCSLEAEARLEHRGLWASPDAIAPWAYRRRNQAAARPHSISETAESCVAAIGKPYS